MKITNRYNLPDTIVQAISNPKYSKGKADISVTGLIKPPQMRVLEKLHGDELEEDVSDRIFALLGSATHAMLDRIDIKEALREERLYAEVNGWKVSGQADLLHGKTLTDYKVTSVYAIKDGVKPEWVVQLNLYRYLYFVNGFKDIDKLQIVAILRDHSKTKAKIEKDYPPPAICLDVPLWPIEEAKEWIISRVKLQQDAERVKPEELPSCTDEEIWRRPPCWAHMKKGNKRALKLYWKEEDVPKQLPQGTEIVYRPGECIRCESYCIVKKFCKQARGNNV